MSERRRRGRVDAGLRWLVVVSPAVLLLVGVVDWLVGRARRGDRETGASVVEWVLVTAVLITIAVGVGGIVYSKVRSKAEGLDLTTP